MPCYWNCLHAASVAVRSFADALDEEDEPDQHQHHNHHYVGPTATAKSGSMLAIGGEDLERSAQT
jgi:hypothetical protein